jgi:16S rRNA (cytosine967-C5)-methyltransferase
MQRGPHNATPGRIAAARALLDVADGQRSEVALRAHLPQDPAERRLQWHLALGVLRGRGRLDAALRTAIDRPLDALEPGVLAVLRLGAFEKLASRTPPHAVVHQAVELSRSLGLGRASGLVNAVLRRCYLPRDIAYHDWLDHPEWLVERWAERYGDEATEHWCRRNGKPPPRFVIARDDLEAVEALFAAEEIETRRVTLSDEAVPNALQIRHQGPVDHLPGYAEGTWWVQDVASASMADLVPADAARVLDACAAPGGKSLRLASRGAAVTAVDVDARRLQTLHETLGRVGVEAEVKQHDWLSGPMGGGTWDAVLVDAPCTGLGTVRRRPEIRWRRGPMDPAMASNRQKTILANAATHVAEGGCVVYVVCSAEPEEGPEVVKQFLRDHPGWTLEVERSTAPPERGEDAFYGARIRR